MSGLAAAVAAWWRAVGEEEDGEAQRAWGAGEDVAQQRRLICKQEGGAV